VKLIVAMVVATAIAIGLLIIALPTPSKPYPGERCYEHKEQWYCISRYRDKLCVRTASSFACEKDI
jgi:hypothetical protein